MRQMRLTLVATPETLGGPSFFVRSGKSFPSFKMTPRFLYGTRDRCIASQGDRMDYLFIRCATEETAATQCGFERLDRPGKDAARRGEFPLLGEDGTVLRFGIGFKFGPLNLERNQQIEPV